MSRRVMRAGHGWPSEVWSWSPELGRWSPKYGLPKQPVLFQISTDAVPPEEAYDSWRDIAYYYFDADRYSEDEGRGFRAETTVIATSMGNIYSYSYSYSYSSDAVAGKRVPRDIRKDEGHTFDLGIVLSGRRLHRDETDSVYIATPGEFFCYDPAKASRIEWSDHRGVHLTLPRALIAECIGEIPPASELMRALRMSNLTPFLRAHFQLLASNLNRLNVVERATIFDQSVDLILTVMRQVLRPGAAGVPKDRHAYYVAAKRVIMKEMANPNLEPAMVARILGCSRATLYRAFAERGWTVAEYIREVRLRDALRRLSTAEKGTSIEAIARSCGFVNLSHFGRVFRSRFGISPKEVLILSTFQHLSPPSPDN